MKALVHLQGILMHIQLAVNFYLDTVAMLRGVAIAAHQLNAFVGVIDLYAVAKAF